MTITELTEALATRKLRPSVAELAKLLDAIYSNVWPELGGWLPMDCEDAGFALLKAERDAQPCEPVVFGSEAELDSKARLEWRMAA